MRIENFSLHHVRIPLRKRIRHASHERVLTDSVIVSCRLDSGQIGWGEGLPREYVTGETIDDAWSLVTSGDWAHQLGAGISSLAEAVALCDSIQLQPDTSGRRECFGNSARCAIELSVLDAVARATERPLSDVTRLTPETLRIRQNTPRVRYSAAITAQSEAREAWQAWLFWLAGFKQCKVKVGVAGRDDRAALERIRARMGPDVKIRLDANEAWTCATLETHLQPLLEFGIASIEQPVPHAEVAGLAALRGRLPIPVMLDESLCCREDALRAIELGTCDQFNIRLSKCGGFLPALRIAALAAHAGLSSQLGCQVGETGILSAAGRHFATSVGGLTALEGSYDSFLVRERLTVENLTCGLGGRAPAIVRPGLGVTIDLKALARVTVREARVAVR